jgi:hypothetical protein
MPRVTCRCGEKLKVPTESVDHLYCARCGARVRVRNMMPEGTPSSGDGFIRFVCPCGRRLKVSADERPTAGRCPDCGRVVPVPTSKFGTINPAPAKSDSEARTEDLDASDLAELKKWSERYSTGSGEAQDNSAEPRPATGVLGVDNDDFGLPSPSNVPRASVVKFETGLRICPQCHKPLHLGADHCRDCGTRVPRQ